MRRILSLFLLLIGTAAYGASEPPAEIKAAWVSAFANGTPASPTQLEETMDRLRKAGANAVYIEATRDGATLFPSAPAKAAGGAERHAALAADKRDLLEETLIEAHRHGLYAYAWFDAGYLAKAGAREVVLDAVRNYDVDGVALEAQAAGAADLGSALGQAYPGLGLAMLAPPAPAALAAGTLMAPAPAPAGFAARADAIRLWRYPLRSSALREAWKTRDLPRGRYSLVGRRTGGGWEVVRELEQDRLGLSLGEFYIFENDFYSELELVPNRRELLRRKPRT